MLLNSVESQFFDVCHISSALDSPWLSNTRATEKDMFRKPGHSLQDSALYLPCRNRRAYAVDQECIFPERRSE